MTLTTHPLSLAIAACMAGGCSVERLTAVEPIESPTADAAAHGQSPLDATTDAFNDDSDGPPSSGDDDTVDASMCEDAVFFTAQPLGIWNDVDDAGYNVFNNVYNTDADPGPQGLYACSYHSWYATSDQPGNAGVVGSYPNVQVNYYTKVGDASVAPAVGSFQTITSTFAEMGPHVGVYEFAYDIWLNGIVSAGSSQILIWVDNFNRVPAGSLLETTTVDGRTYEVWTTPDNASIVLKSTTPFTYGTVDLFAIIRWAIDQSLLRSDSTLWQIDFGVEIESTAGENAKFQVEDFSITTM